MYEVVVLMILMKTNDNNDDNDDDDNEGIIINVMKIMHNEMIMTMKW